MKIANGFTVIARTIRSAAAILTVPAKPPRKSPSPSWRRSFFQNHPVKIASARAGNVIGGGDWAKGALCPTAFAPCNKVQAIAVRNPSGHAPLAARARTFERLSLARRQTHLNPAATPLDSAFNFGPAPGQPHRRRTGRGSPQALAGALGKSEPTPRCMRRGCFNWPRTRPLRCSAGRRSGISPQPLQHTIQWYRPRTKKVPGGDPQIDHGPNP